MRGSAIDTSRSRNSHIRSPRSVTRALTGNRRQLLDRAVERLRLGLRLADAHVERDLGDARHAHQRPEAELLLELGAELVLVALLQARNMSVFGRHYLSISWRQSSRRQTRTRRRSPLISLMTTPTRVGRLHVGQTSITFEIGIGAAFSITPPGVTCWPPIRLESLIGFGRLC